MGDITHHRDDGLRLADEVIQEIDLMHRMVESASTPLIGPGPSPPERVVVRSPVPEGVDLGIEDTS